MSEPLKGLGLTPEEVRRRMLLGIVGLRNPNWHDMSNEDRLLHACLIAYRKHVAGDDNFGWDELGDMLHNAIYNTIGYDKFVEWNERSAWK